MKHKLNEIRSNISDPETSKKITENKFTSESEYLSYAIDYRKIKNKRDEYFQENEGEKRNPELSISVKRKLDIKGNPNHIESDCLMSKDMFSQTYSTEKQYLEIKKFERYGLCEKSTQTLLTMGEIEEYEAIKYIPKNQLLSNALQSSPDLILKIFGKFHFIDNFIYKNSGDFICRQNMSIIPQNNLGSIQKPKEVQKLAPGFILQTDISENGITKRKRKNPLNYDDFNKNGIIDKYAFHAYPEDSKAPVRNTSPSNIHDSKNGDNQSNQPFDNIFKQENLPSDHCINNKINIKRKIDNRRKPKFKDITKDKAYSTRIHGLEKPSGLRISKNQKINCGKSSIGTNAEAHSNAHDHKIKDKPILHTDNQNDIILNLNESSDYSSCEPIKPRNAKIKKSIANLNAQKKSFPKTEKFPKAEKISKNFIMDEKYLSSAFEDFSKSSENSFVKRELTLLNEVIENILPSKDVQNSDNIYLSDNKSHLNDKLKKNQAKLNKSPLRCKVRYNLNKLIIFYVFSFSYQLI